jgi:disulfide bond formation protein DsbB/mono/diheme cytochrome c family protein
MDSEQINDWINRSAMYVALIVAWVATLGSLYFSEVLGYIPCELCWYQRIFMYPMALLIALGLLRYDTHLPHLVIPFTVIGGAISSYHYLLQKTDLFDSAATCQVGVPCSSAWINWFGFVTIPFLALVAFFLITMFSIVAVFAHEPQRRAEQGRPWLAVGGAVACVIAVFSIMGLVHEEPTQALAMSDLELVDASHLSTPVDAAAIDIATGETLYSQACAACHGPDAAGIENLGNSLIASDAINLPDEEAVAFIREGIMLDDPRNSTGLVMPPSGGRPDLSDADLLSIVHYIRELSGNVP